MEKALDFLFENGFYTYAQEVGENILARVGELDNTPLMYPPDKYKKQNDGSYRAFLK